MASNILVEKATEQNIQILQFRNKQLAEQLVNLKKQVAALESSASKHDEDKKQYADTMLCVSRIWDQLNADIQGLCARCVGKTAGTANPASSSDRHSPSAAADAQNQEDVDPSLESWEAFDPFLRRLLANNDEAALADRKQIKRNLQDYQRDLTEVEQALHKRSAASLQALSKLLQLVQQRSEAANQQLEKLRKLSTDDALKHANEQLQTEAGSLRQQLDAAQALQRSMQVLLKQSQDHAFEAAESLKSIKNDLADKEYALQAAQRKLERLKQQQGDTKAGSSSAMPGLGGVQASAAGAGAAEGTAGPAGALSAAVGTGSASGDDLQAQVQELRTLLEQRTAEKDAEAAAHAATKQELSAAKARFEDETWVQQQSALYQHAQKQLAEAGQLVEAKAKAVAALQHDKDELLRHFEAKQAKEEMEKVMRSKLIALQQQVDELNVKQMELLQQKQAMQVAHQQELQRFGHAKTTAELQAMVAALQKEVDTHAGHARKAAEASASADAARKEAADARAALRTSQTLVKSLQQRLATKAAELSGLSGREEELKERLNDLNAFVEVLTTFTSDARDMLEVRRSEASLKLKVTYLNTKLKGDQLQQQLTGVSASEAKLRQDLEVTASQAAELQGQVAALQEQVNGLHGEVSKKQAESEAFAQEINEAYNAFEGQRQQNSTLLTQLTERDAALATGQQERLRLEHQLAHMNEQLNAAHVELATLRGELGQLAALKEATEADLAHISADLAAAREQVLLHSATIERLKQDLKTREDEKAALEILLEKERAATATRVRAAEEDATALNEERAKRQRLEDANKMLNGKLERMIKNANTSEAVQELEEEIEALRRLLKCNVCHTRQKDVIITKCWHMFCKPCINKNLEARHRKCPGCGHPFGAADVKQFFFT